jgi:hypothetical protein
LALKALSTGSTLTTAADVDDEAVTDVWGGLEAEVEVAASEAGGVVAAPDEQAESRTPRPTLVIKTIAGFAIMRSLPCSGTPWLPTARRPVNC